MMPSIAVLSSPKATAIAMRSSVLIVMEAPVKEQDKLRINC